MLCIFILFRKYSMRWIHLALKICVPCLGLKSSYCVKNVSNGTQNYRNPLGSELALTILFVIFFALKLQFAVQTWHLLYDTISPDVCILNKYAHNLGFLKRTSLRFCAFAAVKPCEIHLLSKFNSQENEE